MTNMPPENADDYLDPLDAEQMPSPWSGPLQKLFFLLFVVGIVAAIWGVIWISSQVKKKNSESRKKNAVADTYDSVLQRGTATQLKDFSNRLRAQLSNANLTRKIGLVSQRIEIADRILDVSSESFDVEYAQLSKLESLSLQNDLNVQNNLPTESTENSLIDTANALVDSPLPKVRSYAHLAKILMAILKFGKQKESLETCLKYLDASENDLNSTEVDAKRLVNMVRYLNDSLDIADSEVLKTRICQILLKSEIEEVRNLGVKATALVLDHRHDFAKLLEKMEFDSSKTWGPLAEAYIRDVISTPEVPIPTYLKAILYIENLYRIGESELAKALFQEVSGKVSKLENTEAQSKIQIALDAHEKRISLVGTTLVLDVVDCNGQPLKARISQKPVGLLLFTKNAVGALKYIQAINSLEASDVKFVAIGVDQSERSAMEPLARQFQSIHWVAGSDAKDVLSQIPITFSPYLILIDKNGKVNNVNVGLANMRNALKQLGD